MWKIIFLFPAKGLHLPREYLYYNPNICSSKGGGPGSAGFQIFPESKGAGPYFTAKKNRPCPKGEHGRLDRKKKGGIMKVVPYFNVF